MDWILSVTTLVVNWSLGWYGKKWWIWVVHSINAAAWIIYSLAIEQYGLILLSVVTVLVDLITAYKVRKDGVQVL